MIYLSFDDNNDNKSINPCMLLCDENETLTIVKYDITLCFNCTGYPSIS